MKRTVLMNAVLAFARHMADDERHEYILLEHLLVGLLGLHPKMESFSKQLFYKDYTALGKEIMDWLHNLESVPRHIKNYRSKTSLDVREMIDYCLKHQESYAPDLCLTAVGFLRYVLETEQTFAQFFLLKNLRVSEAQFLETMQSLDAVGDIIDNDDEMISQYTNDDFEEFDDDDDDDFDDDDYDLDYSDIDEFFEHRNREHHGLSGGSPLSRSDDDEDWQRWVTDISEKAMQHTPLIGREEELDRTIQILCRMEKNNPLHIGESGVGKTALVYGLAQRINNNEDIPERLRGAHIFGLDMGQLVAGTQYRGAFEERMKMVLDSAAEAGNVILYLDEIHQIVGAGSVGSNDGTSAGELLKPYLAEGKVRFIGSTTYEDFNRVLAQDKAFTRRFQQIDIHEPSVDDTLRIVEALIPTYQHFHHVTYRREAWEFAVRASAKHIPQRRLPDKALDLIDEAGAYLEVHPSSYSRSYVTRGLMQQLLQKACRIEASVLKEADNDSLRDMESLIRQQIFGQDESVKRLVEAVMMAKAGLTDDDKPLASLLFVGPTGVGKTEVARVLAKQLGVELVRFDMSEYAEKHTVAKLIGSPAGYVGYEDGGLLTAAIRRSPNCVLLLDEIEKAHADIYNILLQVMDYARLTDNRGQQADFRQVILIMTSNAGAQYASQSSIGFTGGTSRGDAMKSQVKKTFKPEFINRLTDIVVFHDMNREMATQIMHKKLQLLDAKLAARQAKVQYTAAALAELLRLGFTPEYGAREMERVIGAQVKPLLMRELLFGCLRKGGCVEVDFVKKAFVVRPVKTKK